MSINVIIIIFLTLCGYSFGKTIIINPAGDYQQTGRIIDESFERTITRTMATMISSALSPEHYCILYPKGTTILSPWSIAQYSNTSSADLLLALRCYKTDHDRMHLHIGYCLFNQTDSWKHQFNPLFCLSYDQAHIPSLVTTQQMAHQLSTRLATKEFLPFLNTALISAPLIPLVGCSKPALLLEFGLVNDKDWKKTFELIVPALVTLCRNI